MIYLLDADTLISADRIYYPLKRFPVFWQWLHYNGQKDIIKVPEQYEEVVAGKGELVDWLKEKDNKDALLLGESVDQNIVGKVISEGYAPDLDEAELEAVGRDPFLIAYGVAFPNGRRVVSFEVSSPGKQRANKKIPDVCAAFDVKCINLFQLLNELDFTTNWKP